jgi:hypothetical protein
LDALGRHPGVQHGADPILAGDNAAVLEHVADLRMTTSTLATVMHVASGI